MRSLTPAGATAVVGGACRALMSERPGGRAQIRRMRCTRWRRAPETGARARSGTGAAHVCGASVRAATATGGVSAATSLRPISARAAGRAAKLVPLAQQAGSGARAGTWSGAAGGCASGTAAAAAAWCAGQCTADAVRAAVCRTTPHSLLACASPDPSSAIRTTNAIAARLRICSPRRRRAARRVSSEVDKCSRSPWFDGLTSELAERNTSFTSRRKRRRRFPRRTKLNEPCMVKPAR